MAQKYHDPHPPGQPRLPGEPIHPLYPNPNQVSWRGDRPIQGRDIGPGFATSPGYFYPPGAPTRLRLDVMQLRGYHETPPKLHAHYTPRPPHRTECPPVRFNSPLRPERPRLPPPLLIEAQGYPHLHMHSRPCDKPRRSCHDDEEEKKNYVCESWSRGPRSPLMGPKYRQDINQVTPPKILRPQRPIRHLAPYDGPPRLMRFTPPRPLYPGDRVAPYVRPPGDMMVRAPGSDYDPKLISPHKQHLQPGNAGYGEPFYPYGEPVLPDTVRPSAGVNLVTPESHVEAYPLQGVKTVTDLTPAEIKKYLRMYYNNIEEVDEKEVISCKICHCMFDEPRTLPCMHYFCSRCIATLMDDKKTYEEYQCPQCLKIHFVTEEREKGVPKTHYIFALYEFAVQMAQCQERYGDCYSTTERSQRKHHLPRHRCRTCKIYLCNECADHHKKCQHCTVLPIYENHAKYLRTRVVYQTMFCALHHQPLFVYCAHEDCHRSVCEECADTIHIPNGHILSGLGAISQLMMNMVEYYCINIIRRGIFHINWQLDNLKDYRRKLFLKYNYNLKILDYKKKRAKMFINAMERRLLAEWSKINNILLGENEQDIIEYMMVVVQLKEIESNLYTLDILANDATYQELVTYMIFWAQCWVQEASVAREFKQVPWCQQLGEPEARLGVNIHKMKIKRSVKALSHPIETFTTKGDITVIGHHTKTGNKHTVLNVVGNHPMEIAKWKNIIRNETPRLTDATFSKYAGEDVLVAIDRQEYVADDLFTHPYMFPIDHVILEHFLKFKGDHCIKILKPKECLHTIERKDFSPVSLTRYHEIPGFLYATKLTEDNPALIVHWVDRDNETILKPGGHRMFVPTKIVTNSVDQIIVLDTEKDKLFIFSQTGTTIDEIILPHRHHATCMAVDSRDYIYVGYTGLHRIDRLAPNGQFLENYLTYDDGLQYPTFISTHYERDLIVGTLAGDLLYCDYE